jgi:hypothetical protein
VERAVTFVVWLAACATVQPAAPAATPLEATPELSGSDAPAEIAGCTPPQRGRTWVGFSHPFELADFGEAAARAEAIIAHLAASACEPQPSADPQGVLMATHAAHAMWIARITFQSPALDDAEVLLERVGGTGEPLALRLALTPPPQAQAQEPALWRLTAVEAR